MVVTVGQQLPPEHHYHGALIWGVAWFPVLLVLTLSIVMGGKTETKFLPWLAALGLSYGVLLIEALWQSQSIWLLLTLAGLMECGAMAVGYLIAIVWVGLQHQAGFSEWFFPQLFGVALLAILLAVVGRVMWGLQLLHWLDLPGLAIATILRAWPITKAMRNVLS